MGIELDAEVAEKVMGWEKSSSGHWFQGYDACPEYANRRPDGLPRFSTDIAAAWEVVEKAAGDRVRVAIHYDRESVKYVAQFCSMDYKNASSATADTAPEAICLAALKAVE